MITCDIIACLKLILSTCSIFDETHIQDVLEIGQPLYKCINSINSNKKCIYIYIYIRYASQICLDLISQVSHDKNLCG